MQTKCQPCLDIRMFFHLLFKHSKVFYINLRKDLRSYSMVNQVSCVIHSNENPNLIKSLDDDSGVSKVKQIRVSAQNFYQNSPLWTPTERAVNECRRKVKCEEEEYQVVRWAKWRKENGYKEF